MSEELINWWSAFHFLRPWLLLLLLAPLVFYGRYFRGRNNQSSWEKVCDKKLLDYLLVRGSSSQRKVMAWLGMIGIITAMIAAAGPSWIKQEIPSLAPENPIMMILNLSSDMKGQDLTPTRLERAKFMMKDMLESLRGAQTGLEVYSSEPFLISPLTEDQQILINLLPAIDYNIMPINGDRLDRAILLAIQKMQAAGYQQGNMLVFTADVGSRLDLAIEAAKRAKAANFKVNVLAAAVHPSEKLQLVAEAGGGQYLNLATQSREIMKLAEQLGENSGRLKESKNWQTIWLDYGYYLLVVPLLCCLYFFRRGILVIALLLVASNAEASFFLNPNQEGFKAFGQEDYQRASTTFEDSRWKGSALYRAGDYEQAYREFASGNDVTALYNQGNALAKGGQIPEAIKKYEEVLKLEPQHEDAKFNLEYLKQQQQQQQQESQSDSQDQQDKQDKQQQQSSAESSQSKDGQEKSPKEQPAQSPSGQDEKPQPSESGEQPQEQNQQSQPKPQPMSSEEQKTEEQPQNQSGGLQKEQQSPKYDEKQQAKAQQYREIPEDPGGLLKAFIYKEYNRNRYQDK